MVAEAVNSVKEIAIAAASQQIVDFVINNLKDYVSKFFKELLENEDVAPFSETQAILTRLKEVKDAHKDLITKISSSTFVAN